MLKEIKIVLQTDYRGSMRLICGHLLGEKVAHGSTPILNINKEDAEKLNVKIGMYGVIIEQQDSKKDKITIFKIQSIPNQKDEYCMCAQCANFGNDKKINMDKCICLKCNICDKKESTMECWIL